VARLYGAYSAPTLDLRFDNQRKIAVSIVERFITQSELAEYLDLEYLGTSDRDTLLWLRIGSNNYVYSKAPGQDPIKEIARKFEKLMQYSPGKALAWLKTSAILRDKHPAKQESRFPMSAEEVIERIAQARSAGDILRVIRKHHPLKEMCSCLR
jgi:hypothetical protein